MLPLSQRIAFFLFALLTITLGARGFYRLYRRISRGRADIDARTNRPLRRAWYALQTTLLQERVFRRRIALSVFHAFIFYAFVLYLLVNLLDALGGYVDLRTIPSPLLVGTYGALSDTFSILAIIGVLAFILRRFLLKSRRDFRFNDRTLLQPVLRRGYMKRDSLIVAVFILFHVGSRIVGHAAALAIAGPRRAEPFSSFLASGFVGHHALAWRIFGYWGALGSVLLFLLYFPYSKHIHLLMAPLNYFFRRDTGSGVLPPLKLDLDAPEPELGAAQLADLAWPRLLDAYACIQCNRCQDVCPATQTGKALSPAALEINKRMELNIIARERSVFSLNGEAAFEARASAGPSLLDSVISSQAVWACTTCGACMDICPTQNEQMLDIIDMRRNMVLQQGEFPAQLANAFRGMERNGNPWAIASDKRMDWAESLNVPTIDEVPDPDVLYWVGCAASYDASASKTARAVVQLLSEASIRFAVLGKRESCTGDSARRAGNELLYQKLAGSAIETLNDVRPRLVIASCPHCVNTIANEYPQLGGNFTVMHHTEYLAAMLKDGKLAPTSTGAAITFHDPCYLGRHRGSYAPPRSVLHVLTSELVELPRSKSNSFCCGAGGAQFWKEEEPGDERISENRFREAQQTLNSDAPEKVLAVGCPFCKSMLQSSPSAVADSSIAIKDVAELLWEGVQRTKGSTTLEAAAAPAVTLFADAPAPAMPNEPAHVASSTSMTVETSPEPLVGAEEPPSPLAPASARKKWTPKKTASASDVAAVAPPPAEAAPQETFSAPAPPVRKKWKPGG